MRTMRMVFGLTALVLLPLWCAAEEPKLPPGTKLPPQPREWGAPATDMTPPPADALFTGEWKKDRSLPLPLAGHSVVTSGDRIFVLGGVSGREHLGRREVYVAQASRGVLGSWTKTKPLPLPVAFGAAVSAAGRVYVIAGANREGMHNLSGFVYSAPVTGAGLGAWREEAKLPSPLMYHAATTVDGILYVLGGFDGQAYSDKLLYARLGKDGKVGEWKEATARYPQPIGRTVMVPVGNDVMVIGGLFWDSQGEHINSIIMRGKRQPDGDVKEWAGEGGLKIASRSMTYSLAEHGGAASGRFVYVAGGRDPAALGVATVQAAWIDEDGKLTRWQFGKEMPAWGIKGPRQPVRLYQTAAAVAGGRLYVIGGFLSIREPTTHTWSIGLKSYRDPDWVKARKAKAAGKGGEKAK